MRARELIAMGAGVAGACLAHALDRAGLLPGIHEAANVRDAMGLGLTMSWLALAAALSRLAARHGAVRVGAPAALLVSALPELLVRHDIGAVLEPGAVAGAAVQWLLLLAVLAVVVTTSRAALAVLLPSYGAVPWPRPSATHQHAPRQIVGRRGRPRGPPDHCLSVPVI